MEDDQQAEGIRADSPGAGSDHDDAARFEAVLASLNPDSLSSFCRTIREQLDKRLAAIQ